MEDLFWKCLLLLFVWILETQPLPGKTTKPNITILWTREASRTWTPWVWLWCFSLGFWVSPCSLVVGVILGEDHLCVLSDWQGCVHKSLLAIRRAFAYFPGKKAPRGRWLQQLPGTQGEKQAACRADIDSSFGGSNQHHMWGLSLPCLLSSLGKNRPHTPEWCGGLGAFPNKTVQNSLPRSSTEEKTLWDSSLSHSLKEIVIACAAIWLFGGEGSDSVG